MERPYIWFRTARGFLAAIVGALAAMLAMCLILPAMPANHGSRFVVVLALFVLAIVPAFLVENRANATTNVESLRRWKFRMAGMALCTVAAAYFVVAYLFLPLAWRRYEKRHPALDEAPHITHTVSGIPGDPINVGLVATEEQIQRAMHAAKWYPADPITLDSSIRIVGSTVFHRPYDDAPVSSLYLRGRKQDLAFEQPVGDDARRRHHVRFWRSERLDEVGRPLWLGAVTFDTRVGFSHTTGEVTHHIGADVDADRDRLMDDLKQAGMLADEYWVEDFQQPPEGRNGGGDPWRTDGRLAVGVLDAK